jgi:hypothetical protein
MKHSALGKSAIEADPSATSPTHAASREIVLCETLKLFPMSRIGSPD